MQTAPTRRRRPLLPLLLLLALVAGCSNGSEYGDPWTNRSQEERLGSEGERDPETSQALRERLRYNQADR